MLSSSKPASVEDTELGEETTPNQPPSPHVSGTSSPHGLGTSCLSPCLGHLLPLYLRHLLSPCLGHFLPSYLGYHLPSYLGDPPAVMSRAPPTKYLGHRRQPQPVHVDLECQALAEDSYRARPRHHHTSPWRCFMTIPAHTASLCAKREDTWAMNGSIIYWSQVQGDCRRRSEHLLRQDLRPAGIYEKPRVSNQQNKESYTILKMIGERDREWQPLDATEVRWYPLHSWCATGTTCNVSGLSRIFLREGRQLLKWQC